jgi:hypothetical protein
MGERVSWLAIKVGWKVLAADGTEIGEVDEVAGDERRDIFDGLSVATSALGHTRYATADQVTTIEEGVVWLALTHAEALGLAAYEEPATSLRIEPDDRGGARQAMGAETRKLESKVMAPTQRHEHQLGLIARIWHLLQRKRGR